MCARLRDAQLPLLVLVDRRGPGDVVNGAGAGDPALGGRRVVGIGGATLVPAHLPALGAACEAQGLLEERAAALGRGRVGADAVEALERELGRNLRVIGDEGLVVGLGDDELEPHPFRVAEAQAGRVPLHLDPVRSEPLRPELERLGRGDPPGDPVDHPGARAPGNRSRILEEGQIAPGAPDLVGVEQVVDGRVVLVDRLLHEAQPEDAGVEVEVPRRVARDRRDVMDPFESHSRSFPCRLVLPPRQ